MHIFQVFCIVDYNHNQTSSFITHLLTAHPHRAQSFLVVTAFRESEILQVGEMHTCLHIFAAPWFALVMRCGCRAMWSMVPLPHPIPPLVRETASLPRWTHKSDATLVAHDEKLRIILTTAGGVCTTVHQQVSIRGQTNRLSIKVVIPTNCDAMLLQPVKQGKNETLRREREREGEGVGGALRYLVDVPFLTSQMLHLKASAVFLKVQTLQSQ